MSALRQSSLVTGKHADAKVQTTLLRHTQLPSTNLTPVNSPCCMRLLATPTRAELWGPEHIVGRHKPQRVTRGCSIVRLKPSGYENVDSSLPEVSTLVGPRIRCPDKWASQPHLVLHHDFVRRPAREAQVALSCCDVLVMGISRSELDVISPCRSLQVASAPPVQIQASWRWV
jgi:hypothetical protein